MNDGLHPLLAVLVILGTLYWIFRSLRSGR